MLQVDLVRRRARAGLVWDKDFHQSFYIFMILNKLYRLYYSTFDNYNSVYNYGF